MGTGIKGFKSQKMLKTKLKGYTDDQSIDPERYVTIQEIPGDRYAADVMIHGAFKVNLLGVLTVAAGSNVRVIKCTAHGAQKGDFVKFVDDATDVQVLSVPDANTIILATELSFDPTGLTFDVLRSVTPSYNKDGSMNVLSAQGPVQYRDANTGLPQETVFDETDITNNRPLPSMNTFKQDGNYVPVVEDSADLTKNAPLPSGVMVKKDGDYAPIAEDSAVAANNKPMPSGLMIKKDDGNYYPVTLDTTNPYQHTPIPVAITDVTGTSNVTINAGDIQVGIKHNGADPSSVRIGDGTTLAGVTASNELKTNDASAGTKLDTLHTDLGLVATSANQTNGNQITQIKSGSNGNILDIMPIATNPNGGDKGLVAHAIMHGKDGSNFNDVKVNSSGEMSVTATSFPLATGAATSAKQDTGNSSLSSIDTKLTNVATTTLQTAGNSSLSSIDGKLPLSLGAKAGSASLSVVPATDGVFLVVPSTPAASTISSTQATVGLTAVRATVSGSAPSATRKKLWIKPSKNNLGAIYIGSSSVTIGTGMEIIGPDRWEILNDSNDWYLISDTAGQVVEIVEVL